MTDEEINLYANLTSYGVDDGDSVNVFANAKVYDGRGWYVTIRLSDIVGAEITTIEDDETGRDVHGMFIPFRKGGLTLTPKRKVLLVCKAEMAQVPMSGYTHLLTQICDRDVLAERQRLGFKTGFIGKMKPMGSKNDKKRRKI